MDDQALEWFSEKNKLHEISMKSKLENKKSYANESRWLYFGFYTIKTYLNLIQRTLDTTYTWYLNIN